MRSDDISDELQLSEEEVQLIEEECTALLKWVSGIEITEEEGKVVAAWLSGTSTLNKTA